MAKQQEMISQQQEQLMEQQRKVAEQAQQIEEAKKQASAARKSATSVLKEAQARNTASNDRANLAEAASVAASVANKSNKGTSKVKKPTVNKAPGASKKGRNKKNNEAQPSAAANKENIGPSIKESDKDDSSNNVRHAVLCTTFSTCGCSNDFSI
jgi:superfamily II DNA helicase RecQ